MTVFQETALVAGREVKRNLRSAKGVVLLVLCVLGGVIAALIMAWARKMQLENAAARQVTPEGVKAMQEMLLAARYNDEAMGKYLAQAPFVLLAATLTGVWLAPLLVALVGFDSISTDLQHRGIRYFTLRVKRVSYYAGKLLGLWAVVSLMMLVSHAMIWAVALARGTATVGEIGSWGIRFWLVTVFVAAAWSGLAQLVSSQFKVPILALLVTLASFFVIWIIDAIGELSEKLRALVYIYPNTYDAWLLSPHADKIAIGVGVCLAFMALSSVAGALIFARRDL